MDFVPRRFRQISPESEKPVEGPFSMFEDCPVIVVLGEPGMGKSTCFHEEAERDSSAECIKVADFLSLKGEYFKETTLFLDALDEARVASGNVMQRLIRQIDDAGPRKVRISCRGSDWRGDADADRLEALYRAPPTILELLPLTPTEIETILRPMVVDERQFIADANDRNLLPLLENPQTLELLMEAVGHGGNWPRSRRDLFETALETLLSEPNKDHQRETDATVQRDRLAQAADHMAAMILLANLDGCALNPASKAEKYPPIQDFQGDVEAMKVAGGRRLFTPVGPERVTLKHRMIGEYLAGRHLAHLIKGGLPLNRVLALITGFDGGTLTDLRGVFAWLTLFLPQEAAEELVKRDPAGAATYGDVASWPLSVCHAVLDTLERDTHFSEIWLREVGRPLHGGFARPELAERLGDFLKSGRGDLLYIAAWSLSTGTPLPILGDDLLVYVRTDTFLACEAANAFAHACPARLSDLRGVLEDIAAGRLEDSLYVLRRDLLRLLYPAHLTPYEVVRLMVPRGKESWFLAGLDVIERTDDDNLIKLAEAMMEFTSACDRGGLDWVQLGDALCARLLPYFGELTRQERYNVLCLGARVGATIAANYEFHDPAVREFLTKHPSTISELLEVWRERYALAGPAEEHRAWTEFRYVTRRSSLPPAAIPDLIDIAREAHSDDLAFWLADEAARLIKELPPHMAQPHLEKLFRVAEGNHRIAECVQRAFVCWLPPRREPDPDAVAKWAMLRSTNQDLVRRERKELAAGKAFELLDYAIRVASEEIVVADIPMLLAAGPLSTPEVRLEAHFGKAVGRVLKGVRAYVANADLPSPEDLALTHLAGGEDPRVKRVDAAIHLIGNDLDVSGLPERCVAALAAQFTGKGTRLSPEWMKRLSAMRVREVAKAVHSYLKTRIRHGEWPSHLLRLERVSIFTPHPFIDIVREECFSYLEHARHCHGDVLRALLHVALARDPARTRLIAAKTLADNTLPSAHLGYWRTVAFLADHTQGAEWKCLVGADAEACRAAFWFVGIALSETGTGLGLSVSHIVCFFETFARPSGVTDADIKHQANVIRPLLNRLANDPSPETTGALARFLSDRTYKEWESQLALAAEAQARLRREVARNVPTLGQIVEALAGGPPANARDRVSVVSESLERIGRELLRGGFDGWKFFWNEDSGTPRSEDSCRDLLMNQLRQKLSPLGMTVEREGYFARHKRADLVVHQGRGKTPIEIKLHWNAALWKAPKEQLQEQYMSDPDCDGFGIYLVLWFGSPWGKKPPASPAGMVPSSPDELLSALQRHHVHPGIRYVVLDCGELRPTRNRTRALRLAD